jgi:murein DD-endopeptidase MepM/ murein hydrolase activator NlpD
MLDERWTVILKPDWLSNSKKISFPKRLISYLFFGSFLLFAFGASGLWAVRDNIIIKINIDHLQAELQELKGIVKQVEAIRKEETIIREFLGIEASDSNLNITGTMGQGGTDPENEFSILSLNPQQEIQEIERSTPPLHVQVHNLKGDLHELLLMLTETKSKLNCRPTIMPVNSKAIWISSGFGWRKSPFTDLREFHKGLDISGKKGTPIIAPADGQVIKTGRNRFIGNYIRIKHDDRFTTTYGHLLKQLVKKREKVKRGQVIGHMGNTGMSTGYHLHYEVIDNERKVNPYNFILNRKETTLTASYH